MSKCKLNTCSELVNSTCVLYTGTLIDGSYITLEGCDPTLDEFLEDVDVLIKDIKDNENILASDIRAANCGFSKIDDLLNDSANLDGTKVKSAKTILTLLGIICDLKTSLENLEAGGIFDIELPASIIDNLKCLGGIINDPCDGPIKIVTLKDLLIQLINKACE